LLALAVPLMAQVPTGTIVGTVADQSGAVIQKATVTVTNKDTGATRVVQTGDNGLFSAPLLAAGAYEVRVEASGFAAVIHSVQVEVGLTSTVNFAMQAGGAKEIVDVIGDSAAPVDLESHTIQGVVTRQQIDNLPLNGRSFLNLAQLEPGVLVTPANPAQFNAQFSVSVLGGPASRTAITVDGSNIRNPIEGGTGQNFSQEVVQEFQLSSTNFDLSTGITAFGSVNIVTRSGGNDFHGTGYFYFRDHNMGAYPSLNRNPLTNDPFFARRQGGVAIGGPIKKDRVFFFFNFENTNQSGVYVVQPDLPSVAGFSTLSSAPYLGKQYSGKVDLRINDKHTAFVRFSHDGNSNSGPFGIPVPPSNFVSNKNWADQSLLGITSVLKVNVVNDFRFSYGYWQNRNIPAPCNGCLGAGGPEVFYLPSVNFALGNNFNSPQGRDLRRFPVSDHVNWQIGNHRVKFGGEWEHFTGTGYWGFFDPARVYLLSPEFLAAINPALPGLFGLPDGKIHSQADLLKLPVVTFILGIGDRAQPSFHLDNAKANERLHFYGQDSWKVTPKLTLNYGVGWEYESNLLNYDLQKPALLAPLYGPNLSPPNHQYKNFEPAVGFAWSVGKNDKTVIRGGAGIFYDTQEGWWRLGERAVIGDSGRQFILNTSVLNPATGQPFSTAFLNSLRYPYGLFLAQLPALRAEENALFPGTGNVPQILVSKQANALGAIYPREFPTTQAQHFNIGVQHELKWGMVVQADFVYRHTIHATPGSFFGASVDFNRFNSISGPVIPKCTQAQANDPNANCSNGPMNFWWPGGTASYKALLVKVDKRFSHRYQFTASYAYQDSKSINDVTQNLVNFFSTYGPDLPKQNLNISGTVDLPWRFQVSLISAVISPPPVEPIISGVDISGTNFSASGTYTPLPGHEYNGFLSHSELQNLVNQYNANFAGKPTPAGAAGLAGSVVAGHFFPQTFPTITLPAHYNLGHDFTSQDLRVQKSFRFKERYEFRIIGEVFNIFNFGNLTGDNFSLTSPSSFGLPTQRVGQTFGSGGPRAFQIAGRFSF
jgi:hypothetical protein